MSVTPFAKPPAKPAQQMVRVTDITSPFFMWEGVVAQVGTADGKQYAQIICAHNGFQFPVLTFGFDQLVEVEVEK